MMNMKVSNKIPILLSLILYSFHFEAFAVLTEEDIIMSSSQHFPLIQEAMKDVEAASGKMMKSQGAFDLKLKGKADTRPKGYYDGESFDLTLEKPIGYLGANIYTGFRKSDGLYPDYEGKYNTLDEGEWRAGLSFSLLRNRGIDSERLSLWNNQLNVEMKEIKLEATKLKVIKEAKKSYWVWVAAGHFLKTYEELLDIAQKRNKGIEKRVAKGDIAQIYQRENLQYIYKRKSQLAEAKNYFYEATQDLSLFLRSEQGSPKTVTIKDLPLVPRIFTDSFHFNIDKDLEIIAQNNPEIASIKLQAQQLENEKKHRRNDLRPLLDLALEVSRDAGQGSKSLQETENRAMLKLEIPIQRRKGRGSINELKAKIEGLKFKETLLKEQIAVELKKLANEIATYKEIILLAENEISLSRELQKAEERKVSQGASDFFVLNVREQNMADAQIKKFKSLLMYQKAKAEYQAVLSLNRLVK